MLKIFLLLVLITHNAYASIDKELAESHKCSRLFSYFEKKYRLPKDALHAISLQESGRMHKIHKIKIVWPWTVNVEGTGYYFDDKNEAVRFVQEQLRKGKESIDVGCMQINLKYHPNAFHSIHQAFTPNSNIAYGASLLRRKYEQLRSWPEAVAHYHSANHEFGGPYKKAVIKIAGKMEDYKHKLRKIYKASYLAMVGQEKQRIFVDDVPLSRSSLHTRNKSYIMVPIPQTIR